MASADKTTELQQRLSGIEARIQALEGSLLLEEPPATIRETLGNEALPPEARVALDDLERRVLELEAHQRTGGSAAPDPTAFAVEVDEGLLQAELEHRDRVWNTILGEETDLTKAQAWATLTDHELYPWSDEMLEAVISIGLNSENDRAREVVWIGADTKHRNTLLVPALLAALSDSNANVREEAADALGHYLGEPGVRKALIAASQLDESAMVRSEASRSLGRQ